MFRAVYLLIWLFPVIVFLDAMVPSNASGEGITLRTEFNHTHADTKTTNKTTGEVATSTFSAFKELYDIDLSRTIFPQLTFSGGTLVELEISKTTLQGTEIYSADRIIRPFAELVLNNPVYRGGIGYRTTQTKEKTTGIPETEQFRDELNAVAGWKPAALPELNLRYVRTHTYDDPKTVDTTDTSLTVDTRYTAWKDLELHYVYTRIDTENGLRDFETLQQTHNGTIDYSHGFFDRRLSVNTGYRIRHSSFEFPGVVNVVESAVLRSAGLSGLDDSPEDGPALGVNNALMEGDVTASSGIDIGLGGDETTLTNIGLDFGFPVNIDKIHVWVDRRLASSVANSFSWSVYTSPDNTDTSTWTLAATIFVASFGSFDNRFEMSFSEVSTRFVKVVTRPLSLAVPDADIFSNIFVTEMQAFTTLSGVRVDNEDITVAHNYNLNLRGKLSDQTMIGYNLYYRLEEQDPSSREDAELSNGIYVNHTFNHVFTGSASVSQTDSKTDDEESTRQTYAASVRAAYLETFGQTLTYSGTKEEEEDGSSDRNSIILRTHAKLYTGWNAFVDTGYGWNRPLDGTPTTRTTVRVGTNLIPNNMLTVNSNYSFTETKQTEGEDQSTSQSQWETRAFFVPFRALSFNIRISFVDREGSTTTLHNCSTNWSPFPDGDLQFFFAYTETLRPESDEKTRTISPGLKWQISRHALIDTSYNITKSETRLVTTDSNSFNVNLKLVF